MDRRARRARRRTPGERAACRSWPRRAAVRSWRASPCRDSGRPRAARRASARSDVRRGVIGPSASRPARRPARACRRLLERREVADHEDLAGGRARVRSGCTRTRPARSSGMPSERASGEACTPRGPEHRPRARAARRRSARRRARRRVTRELVQTCTPSASSCSGARSDRSSGYGGSTRGPASIRTMRALAGSMRRNSRASVWRAISRERARQLDTRRPAADHDEREPGPRGASASSSRSACSNASRIRRRISSASSIVFRPGACGCPLVVAEVGVRARPSRGSGSRRRAPSRRGERAARRRRRP